MFRGIGTKCSSKKSIGLINSFAGIMVIERSTTLKDMAIAKTAIRNGILSGGLYGNAGKN